MKIKVKVDRMDEFGKAMDELNTAYEKLMQAANRIRTEFPEIGLEIGNSTANRRFDRRFEALVEANSGGEDFSVALGYIDEDANRGIQP